MVGRQPAAAVLRPTRFRIQAFGLQRTLARSQRPAQLREAYPISMPALLANGRLSDNPRSEEIKGKALSLSSVTKTM